MTTDLPPLVWANGNNWFFRYGDAFHHVSEMEVVCSFERTYPHLAAGQKRNVSAKRLLEEFGRRVAHFEWTYAPVSSFAPMHPTHPARDRHPGEVLLVPTAPLETNVVARRHEDIEEWLHVFAGERHAELVAWLKAFREPMTPLPILRLGGARQSGRNLLARSLMFFFWPQVINDWPRTERLFSWHIKQSPIVQWSWQRHARKRQTLERALGLVHPITGWQVRTVLHGALRHIHTANAGPEAFLAKDALPLYEANVLEVVAPAQAARLLATHGEEHIRGWLDRHPKSHGRLTEHLKWVMEGGA